MVPYYLVILGVWSAISGHARHFHEHLSVDMPLISVGQFLEFHAHQMKNDSVRVDTAFAFPAVFRNTQNRKMRHLAPSFMSVIYSLFYSFLYFW